MLETILNHSYVFIFVAAAAALAVIASLATTLKRTSDATRQSATSSGKLVPAVVPIASGRRSRADMRSARSNHYGSTT